MTEVSFLVPSREEEFLNRTVNDLLAHCESDYEIIVGLDGYVPAEPLPEHSRLSVLYFPYSIGQRGITNRLAKIARGEYLAKVDAHCSFEQGFDKKLVEVADKDTCLVPTMKNLHAFDWVCECGWREYQGPERKNCPQCGGTNICKDVVWIAKKSPNSRSYCFDSSPHFQYFGDWNKRPQGQGDFTETMSIQGSFFMVHRDTYFDLNICDEETFGSWGSQGIEVAAKFGTSGRRCMCLHTTWYSHLFRTRAGFDHPFPLSGNQVDRAKRAARKLFFESQWTGMTRPLSWLVEKFWPVKGWTDDDLTLLKEGERNSGRWG